MAREPQYPLAREPSEQLYLPKERHQIFWWLPLQRRVPLVMPRPWGLHTYGIYVYILWLWILVRMTFPVWKGEVSMRAYLCASLCNCRHILRAGDDEGLFEVALRYTAIHHRGGEGGYFL